MQYTRDPRCRDYARAECAMKKPSIPYGNSAEAVKAMKENIEVITGKRAGTKIKPLSSDATLSDVIAKINEILEVLQ